MHKPPSSGETLELLAAAAPAEAALAPEDSRRLLEQCYCIFEARLVEIASSSLDLCTDLFEGLDVPKRSADDFLDRRSEWRAVFPKNLRGLFDRRLASETRRGRRPDAEVSLATLRVLTAFDHDKQAALKEMTAFLAGYTRREVAALDHRIELLLPMKGPGDFDDPFSIDYVVDALAVTSRSIYPDPRVWRTLLERLLVDVRSGINKLYMALNAHLADAGVLPDIKAALRARSEHRPADDRDLLGKFTSFIEHGRSLGIDLTVPDVGGERGVAASTPDGVQGAPVSPPASSVVDPQALSAALLALASARPATVGAATAEGQDGDLPQVDSLMALGGSSTLFATLSQWQRLDLQAALSHLVPAADAGGAAALVPINLVPHIRTAISPHIATPADGIAMDVIALLFDYVFRDASISEEAQPLFARLQVPIVKAALLDRSFFSDRNHPARQLLDHLADAAVGTRHHAEYRASFLATAQALVDDLCSRFDIDVALFREADTRLRAFIDLERGRSADSAAADVAAARAAEDRETDRSAVRVLVRERLAATSVPFEVRSFVETIWTDHLVALRTDCGAESEAWKEGLTTLDDLMWSIASRKRTAEKARLARLVPVLVARLRQECLARKLQRERFQPFFDALYKLHIAAIKPRRSTEGGDRAASEMIYPELAVADYVNEIVLGTWLTFHKEGGAAEERLTYISPMRTKFVFTGRYHSEAMVLTPEELVYRLASGKARVLVEPVPLWDRAVSAALDSLARRIPQDAKKKESATMAK
jgi:hypothetical protein